MSAGWAAVGAAQLTWMWSMMAWATAIISGTLESIVDPPLWGARMTLWSRRGCRQPQLQVEALSRAIAGEDVEWCTGVDGARDLEVLEQIVATAA